MQAASQAYQQYKATQVTTASGGELILLAYEGALRWLARAQAALEGERVDIEAAHKGLVRAQAIVAELQAALDRENGGEIAANLDRLYEYIQQLLMEANVHKDVERLKQGAQLLRELHETWMQVARSEKAAAPAPAVVPGRGLNLSL